WPPGGEPRDPSELLLKADTEADAGSSLAPALIDRLRVFQPAEADILLAKLRVRQQNFGDAASALEAALVRLRWDPWPTPQLKEEAVDLAALVGAREAPLGRRMHAALAQPFVLRAAEDRRTVAAADLASRIDEPQLCSNAVGALEPNVPWFVEFLRMRQSCY